MMASDEIGPVANKAVGESVINRIGTSMLLENSIDADANANLTEMNLVNDVTGLSHMASQGISNDISQATLINTNLDQTAS